MSNVVLEDLLSEFTHPMETIQRRNLTLTVETQDTTKAKQLPGVELEISHGFDDEPEPGSIKTGKYILRGERDFLMDNLSCSINIRLTM